MIKRYRKEPYSAAHFLTSSTHSTQNHAEDFHAVPIKAIQVSKLKSPVTVIVHVTTNTTSCVWAFRLRASY